MYVLVTYKNEENQIKNEGARVITALNIYILEARGHNSGVTEIRTYLQKMRKIPSENKA